jgi:hypothetical protein
MSAELHFQMGDLANEIENPDLTDENFVTLAKDGMKVAARYDLMSTSTRGTPMTAQWAIHVSLIAGRERWARIRGELIPS